MTFVLPLLLAVVSTSINLVGGPPVGMDFIAYDPAADRIWVPGGNTGTIQVIDAATGKVNVLAPFPTAPSPRPGRPPMGPSSVAVAGNIVWVGNRADHELIAFDGKTLKAGDKVRLDAMPDGLVYVARKREIWATTPSDRSIQVITTGKNPHVLRKIVLDGSPEGYAVDEERGIFYTNLEDKNRTLAIDVVTRKVIDNWSTGCGPEGPRGLALDPRHRWLFVACTDGAQTFDLTRPGKSTSRLQAGAGVDNLEYDPARKRLFIAAAQAGTLTVVRVGDDGALTVDSTVPTEKGARNPVMDSRGHVYVENPSRGQLLVIDPDAVGRNPAQKK